MESIKNLFGKRIKEFRKNKSLTQAQLAELVEVDDKHISCIESGKNFPSPLLIEKLTVALSVEPKDLFEFYHLQSSTNLKEDICEMLDELKPSELELAYKYIRTFLIK